MSSASSSVEKENVDRIRRTSVSTVAVNARVETDDEDDQHHQKDDGGGANPFNPALFSPGQMQAFQNAVAQFTVSAAANNMDKDQLMNNLTVLQTAFFTLQQQQILQFQLIQHLQSQLLKKTGDKTDENDHEGEQMKEDELKVLPKRLDEPSAELDLR